MDGMHKYDFIFLIISSDDFESYSKMRYYARNYFKLYKTQIKYFFIELKEDLDCDVSEKEDFIYVKGTECITPGMYIKTIKAMKYINEKYNYDFLIRTNLSSFWNLSNLLCLKNNLPCSNFCGGYILFNLFISGTGIILSKDVAINLSKELIVVFEYEDVYITRLLRELGYTLINISQYKMEYLCNNTFCIDDYTLDIPNTLYFRIRNTNGRDIDIEMFKSLYDKIYTMSN